MTKRALTLMGMSGVGKTYFSMKLKEWGWDAYSCDYEIGKDLLGVDGDLTPEDISKLSDFIGMVGDVSKGGLPLDEFKRRQQMYMDAEIKSLMRVEDEIASGQGAAFVNDSTGSLCEIEDQGVIDFVGARSKIVYIKGTKAQEQDLMERAQAYPKPLYYPPSMLDEWIDAFVAEDGCGSVDQMDPKAFARWVFPRLLEARLPKYQTIADQYGVTIASTDLEGIDREDAFLELVYG
jgi:hypothetical protein